MKKLYSWQIILPLTIISYNLLKTLVKNLIFNCMQRID